ELKSSGNKAGCFSLVIQFYQCCCYLGFLCVKEIRRHLASKGVGCESRGSPVERTSFTHKCVLQNRIRASAVVKECGIICGNQVERDLIEPDDGSFEFRRGWRRQPAGHEVFDGGVLEWWRIFVFRG